jgi:tripartite-type tricarboxylate transporter receptor subunit TctC
MKLTRRHVLARASLAAAATPLLWAAPSWAQSAWPTRPVRIVVPTGPGSSLDLIVRAMSDKLAARWGQPVVIENRAGGGGLIGNDAAAKAAPDGHTLLLGAAGPLTVAPHLYAKVPYDPIKDLVPVAHIASTPFVLTVSPSVPVNNLGELIALAKSQPGRLTYGSSGTGGAPHLAGELFCKLAGVKMVHAPYKGLGPAISDLLGGHIQVLFADTGLVLQHIQAGKLKALAVTGAQRTPQLPAIATLREAGLVTYQAGSWYGVLAPAGMSADLMNRINQEIRTALGNADVQRQLLGQGMEPVAMSREQFAQLMREDYDKWGRLIKEVGIKLD